MAGDAGLAAYTTSTVDRYDVRHVDIGFHFLDRPTIWVDHDYTGQYGGPDGSRLRPYASFHGDEGALSHATPGTTVLVLAGQYPLYQAIDFSPSMERVHLIGSGKDVTVLDAENLAGDPVVDVHGTDPPYYPDATVADVTLAALAMRGTENETDPDNTGQGGGIRCYKATGVEIRDCLLAENQADWGGGLYIENAEVTVEDCIIHQNAAISGLAGGGVYVEWCDSSQNRKVTIRRCLISNNTAGDVLQPQDARGGGGIYCWNPAGGAAKTDPEIEDCIISHNRAAGFFGGGVLFDANSQATMRNCIIEHNMATYPSGGRGGGVYIYNSSPTISGCTISGNTSQAGGSGINCVGASSYPNIINCTVAYNIGPQGNSAGIFNEQAHPTIVNCIIWGNGTQLSECLQPTYSCIEGGLPGEGNIPDDPHFVGSIRGPYHLGYVDGGNPCVHTGTTDPQKLPPNYQFPEYDIDGDARRVKIGEVWYVDMGSDQRHPFKEIVGIRKNYDQDTVTITWESENGKSYAVYLSRDAFTNWMAWQHSTDVTATGVTTSWTDAPPNFWSVDQSYYMIQDKNGAYAGVFTRPVGFVNADVQDIDPEGTHQSTFFAIPLEPKYRSINGYFVGGEWENWDESLGSMIAEDLNHGARITFLKLARPQADLPQTWTQLELWITQENGQTKKAWYTTVGTPELSPERFDLAEALRVVQAAVLPARITLLGYVPSRRVSPMVFRSCIEYNHVEFGYPYPVSTTLNAIPFAQYGAVPDGGDQVWIPTAPGEENWKKLHLGTDLEGTPEWKDAEENAATSPDIDVIPGKGFRYYCMYESGVGYDPALYVYYRRVAVTRPYRSE
jgi:hypothetical protein